METFSIDNLFFPWYYEGEFTTTIINTLICNEIIQNIKEELIRLYNDLQTIETINYEFIYINIGAKTNDLFGDYRQIPSFIGTQNTLIILVDIFDSIPNIISEYDMIEIEHMFYKKDNINIRLYNTYFPTCIDINKKFLKDKKIIKKIILARSRSKDKEFVTSFYLNLKRFIENSIVKVCIVSTATFFETTVSDNLNLEMFSEMLELIGINNLILLVWPYNSKFFYAFGTRKKISYIDGISLDGLNNTKACIGNFYKLFTIKELKA